MGEQTQKYEMDLSRVQKESEASKSAHEKKIGGMGIKTKSNDSSFEEDSFENYNY